MLELNLGLLSSLSSPIWFCCVLFVAHCPRGLLPRPCRVLVLLNPRGGKGKALQLFQSRVQPLLEEAEISFKLMLTGKY